MKLYIKSSSGNSEAERIDIMKYDIRGNRKNGYYVDTILENGDRMLGAQRFNSREQAEIYIERQREIEETM